jgi:putative resolvase
MGQVSSLPGSPGRYSSSDPSPYGQDGGDSQRGGDDGVAAAGSGMNGSRTKVRRMLADPKVTAVVVEHRDRLGRMNTELVESALAAHGRRLVVVDDGEVDDDVVRDMVEVLTSFCARLYGRRSARNRALKAVGCAQRDIGPPTRSHG